MGKLWVWLGIKTQSGFPLVFSFAGKKPKNAAWPTLQNLAQNWSTSCNRSISISVSLRKHSLLWIQDRAVLRKCHQSHSFDVIQVRVISEVTVPGLSSLSDSQWLTVLAAETRTTPEMPIIEVLTTYQSIQFKHSKLWSAPLGVGDISTLLPPLQHKPKSFIQGQTNRTRNLWKKIKFFLHQTSAWGSHPGSEYRHA